MQLPAGHKRSTFLLLLLLVLGLEVQSGRGWVPQIQQSRVPTTAWVWPGASSQEDDHSYPLAAACPPFSGVVEPERAVASIPSLTYGAVTTALQRATTVFRAYCGQQRANHLYGTVSLRFTFTVARRRAPVFTPVVE